VKIDADAAGMDAGRLARIDEHLRTRYLEPGKIAGCQVVVARHGAIAHASSLGERDRERARPVTDDTIWRLYSMTKPVTGVALLTLYERGCSSSTTRSTVSCRRGVICGSGNGPMMASGGSSNPTGRCGCGT
jgi:hypothetical protein